MGTSKSEDVAKPSAFPIKSIVWTLFAILTVVVVYFQRDWLNDRFGLDPATPTLVGALLTFITLAVWLSWAVFFRRSILVAATILAIPSIFLTLFYPDFGGDASIRFRPRLWNWRSTNFAEANENVTIAKEIETTPYDFPQFLGPDRNLMVTSVKLKADWTEPPKQLWKIDIGDGWSGFAAVNGLAVTQEQRGQLECVTCYDIFTGRLIWNYQMPRRHEDAMAMGKAGPRATPTIHENRVYATSATGAFDCIDLKSGQLLWSKDIPKLVGIDQVPSTNTLQLNYTVENSALAWGRSCSPLIYENNVIVPGGGPLEVPADGHDPTQTLLAFDKVTGEPAWSGGKRMISYGSPSLMTIDGQDIIALLVQDFAVGHDAKTGRELWAVSRPGKTNGDANCSQVTQVDNNRLLLSKGYGLGGELVDVTRDEDQWTAKSVAKNQRVLRTKFTNLVMIGDYAYSLTDGFLECVHVEEEKLTRMWRRRGRFGDGQVLAVHDKLLVHSESGKLHLVQADPKEYKELASIATIEGYCWNTLCLYGDLLIVRSELEAACFRLPIEGPPLPETQTQDLIDVQTEPPPEKAPEKAATDNASEKAAATR